MIKADFLFQFQTKQLSATSIYIFLKSISTNRQVLFDSVKGNILIYWEFQFNFLILSDTSWI